MTVLLFSVLLMPCARNRGCSRPTCGFPNGSALHKAWKPKFSFGVRCKLCIESRTEEMTRGSFGISQKSLVALRAGTWSCRPTSCCSVGSKFQALGAVQLMDISNISRDHSRILVIVTGVLRMSPNMVTPFSHLLLPCYRVRRAKHWHRRTLARTRQLWRT